MTVYFNILRFHSHTYIPLEKILYIFILHGCWFLFNIMSELNMVIIYI